MRMLLVGGTRFVGRHITAAALDRGHDVTLFHRGRTGADLFPEAAHLVGDRDSDLSALSAGRWDVTVDVSAYLPRQVRALADALGGRGGRYLFVSTTSVYAEPAPPGFREDAPLVPPPDSSVEQVTGETYGGLKVASERTAAEVFGDGLLVVRPTYVVGPYDYTGRFTWWVARLARGGRVLAPAPPDHPLQVIDARDLATWVVRLAERGGSGTFHAVSPPPPFSFRDVLEEVAAEVAPPGTELTWVEEAFLLAAGVVQVQPGGASDGRSLPLWDPGGSGQAADPSAAYASGLAPRPLRQTVRETWAHERTDPTPTPPGIGLDPQREADLLAAWAGR